jgi:co-chaperonin GroES (HSP10)
MGLQVTGHRVLVKPDKVETQSKGGIILTASSYEEKLEEAGQTMGVVVQVGPLAFKAFEVGANGEHIGQPWCKVGDKVQYSKYGGDFTIDPETDETYIVLADEDIKVVVTGDTGNE